MTSKIVVETLELTTLVTGSITNAIGEGRSKVDKAIRVVKEFY